MKKKSILKNPNEVGFWFARQPAKAKKLEPLPYFPVNTVQERKPIVPSGLTAKQAWSQPVTGRSVKKTRKK